MKFSIIILFSLLLPSIAAWGNKAAWEQVLDYTTYLMEEQAYGDDKSRYAVGVGCSGSRPGGRCTFVEFVDYIWRPHEISHPDGTTSMSNRPGQLPLDFPGNGDVDTWLRANVATITSRFLRTGYEFNVDGAKVNGEPNFYESLAKIGQDFRRALYEAPKVLPAVRDLTARADLAVRTVEKLRVKDMDNFRVGRGGGRPGALTTILRGVYNDNDFDIVRKDSLEPALQGENRWKQLDYEGTIARYETRYPDIRTRLDAAIATWASQQTNANHLLAANAANRAKLAMGCTTS